MHVNTRMYMSFPLKNIGMVEVPKNTALSKTTENWAKPIWTLVVETINAMA